MYLKKFQIKNFKSFQDVTIEFNRDVNILTGVNNAGKTTMLEAVALWHECFSNLIQEAKRTTGNYKKGDFVLGNTTNKHFPYDSINSVRSPNFEDIFYQRDKKQLIELQATFENNDREQLLVCFKIAQSGLNYVIELADNTTYDYEQFNDFFKHLPAPVGLYYASPVSSIKQKEKFFTVPQINDAILNRQSASVFRNRLYRLYKGTLFQDFVDDLSYILTNNQNDITISCPSDIQKDVDVVFNFKLGSKDVEKEISLLGSGTLQIMEILLNLYYPDTSQKDINLVLLDEPDSHIHRDIQHRLLQTLTKFTKNTQIFLTTHNESVIRNSTIHNLFHLELKPVNYYRNLGNERIEKRGARFSGIYPVATNQVISSLGYSNGLDFINAVESDCLIFVEGESDARVIDLLIKKGTINNRRRYVYWVFGGVSKMFDQLNHYETVFSSIKNEKSLWEKSALIFDRDYLNDEFLSKVLSGLRLDKKMEAHAWKAYTLESTLFSDLDKLSKLITKWLILNNKAVNEQKILDSLQVQQGFIKSSLEENYSNDFYVRASHQLTSVKDKLNKIFSQDLKLNDHQIQGDLRTYIETTLHEETFYKLMNKNDVEKVISIVVSPYDIEFDIERDFISLIDCVDKSVWFDEWNFLLRL